MADEKLTAIDANLLIRVLTNDPPELAERAAEMIDSRRCYVSAVVVMEVFFVLKSVYRLSKADLLVSLDRLIDIGLVFDRPAALPAVLNWYDAGMDFGDAMTLAYAADADELLTFDRGFATKAKKLSVRPVVLDGLKLPR